MGLFGKKDCAICDGKTGILGGTKVKDGNICKECKKLLSPWFIDYKESTVDDIKKQIEYRKQNQENLKSFEPTRIFGDFGCILIDEKNKRFIAVDDTSEGLFKGPKKVTGVNDIIDKNPDIIEFSQIESIDIDVHESKREEKKTENGTQVSYNPKHYTYMYSFTLEIRVNHPYFHYMRITLNNGTVQIYNEGERLKENLAMKITELILQAPEIDVQNQAEVYDGTSLRNLIFKDKSRMPDYSYGFKCSLKNWEHIQEYGYYLALTKEIYNILMNK